MQPEPDYSQHYCDESFWKKVGQFAKRAGKGVIEKALVMYFAAQSPETPTWAKAVIYGVLGYFILPADALPDTLPAVGFADDLGALAAALAVVALHITPEVQRQAEEKLEHWFGDEDPDIDA